MKESEEKYRSLVEANIVGIILVNMNYVVEANDAFLKIVGFIRQDLEDGKINWRDLTPPEYASIDDKAVSDILEHGRCEPFEKEYFRKDGSRVPVLIGASMVRRLPFECSCFVMDITQNKKSLLGESFQNLFNE